MNAMALTRYEAKVSGIPLEDAAILRRYLADLKEQSTSSYIHAKDAIEFFYGIIQKSIVDMTADDARAVVKEIVNMTRKPIQLKNGTVKIDNRPIAKSTKRSRYLLVLTWVNRAKKEFSAKDIEIKNYFDYIDNPFAEKKAKPTEDTPINTTFNDREGTKFLTDEEVDTIMKRVRFEPRWFEIFLKIIYDTAWRESEVCTTQNKHINFDTTIAGSGNIPDARKEGIVKNPLSKETLADIKSYQLTLKPGEKWLFPSKIIPGSHININNVCEVIRKFSKKIGIKFTSSMFRHTASHNMLMKGVKDEIRAVLTNHATGSNVESKVYAFRNITNKDRVELYNKYHA